MRKDIVIKIDASSRRIDFCALEGIRINPNDFDFVNGEWVGTFNNYPVSDDNKLDILIVVIGNPGTNSTMNVTVDGMDKGKHKLFKEFNRNGYGQFNKNISV